MQLRTWIIGVLLLPILHCFAKQSNGDDKSLSNRPNIVFIVSDDHAWTDYGFMGHSHVHTPVLDRLASESLVYRRGYVPSSLCRASLASMITGLYPHQHRITSNDPPLPVGKQGAEAQRDKTFLEQRQQMIANIDCVATLPRQLQDLGYVSFQTGKWWEGDFKRGGFTDGMSLGGRHGDKGLEIGRTTMAPVFEFIDKAVGDKKPFFLWYAPMLPHSPHNPPAKLLDKYRDKSESLEIAKYWAMIEWFDESCGQLLDHLNKKQLASNTLIVYLADNGWIQDPAKDHYAPKSKQSQYDGGVRTPIMLKMPGKIVPGDSPQLACSIDLAVTIYELLGLKSEGMPGLNLLNQDAVRKRDTIFGECFTHNAVDIERPASSLRFRWCIRGNMKLIVPDPKNEAKSPVELFDLANDPHETKNLASEQATLVAELHKSIDRWWTPN